MKFKLSQNQLTLIISIILVIFYNFAFFSKTVSVYPFDTQNIFFLASIVIVLISATNLILSLLLLIMNAFLSLVRLKVIYKRFFLVLFFLAMSAAYVMDSYSIVIDDTMLLNVLKTDAKESLDLVTLKLFFYIIFLLILPLFLLYKVQVEEVIFKKDLILKLKTILISTLVMFVMVISFGKFYASFLREHKPLRYYTNPTYWIYSMGKFGSSLIKSPNRTLEIIGQNSLISTKDVDRELIILIVGETARRNRFSLNGNENETNPLLKLENVLSFTNVTSCGTSTAISVPCMFSNFGRAKFNVDDANSTENLLDVLSHTNDVNILWRDNNSDSKGVAIRARYEDFKSSSTNTVCDSECRDVGMLVGLQKYIDEVSQKDILIVLHQMGNHGPAYYKRYPKEFEVFKPVCKTSDLAKCTNEEIANAYDNAILYTDFFLSKVIELLKKNSTKFNTGMVYMSDHGESLGENGIYLHGLPYIMAPKEQINVPLIMWFGGEMETETNYTMLKKRLNEPYSHDNIFHTILGMFEVESSVYKPEMDILDGIHIQSNPI